MKPPVIVPPGRPPAPAPMNAKAQHALNGGLTLAAGILLSFTGNPIVPLTHVFQLIPIAIGGSLLLALLFEKFGAYVAYVAFAFHILVLVLCFRADTSAAPAFLSIATYHFTRLVLIWYRENNA